MLASTQRFRLMTDELLRVSGPEIRHMADPHNGGVVMTGPL